MRLLTAKPSSNPYVSGVMGRKEWNDRYLNMRQLIKMWQIGFFVVLAALSLTVFVIAKMASETKLKPFIVETNNGIPYAVKPITNTHMNDDRIINFAVNQFIINTRTVLADVEAEEILLKRAHAFSSTKVSDYLATYYQDNSPFDIQKNKTISVNIINSMPISNTVYQVIWEETEKPIAGNDAPKLSRYVANVSYQFDDVNEESINDNPFGLYITDVTWSKSRTN